MSQSKTAAKLLAAIGAALVAVLVLAPTAPAAEPAPGYEQFAGCPSPEENPQIEVCLRTTIDGGHVQMGSKIVPLSKPMTLSGGTDIEFENFDANSKGGLEAVQQEVPGGLIGLTGLDWLVNFLSLEQLKVYAVTELVGTPDVNVFQEPIELKVKVRLVNPVLGNNCYIGSDSNPIVFALQIGETNPPPPNEPITGKAPVFDEDELGITYLTDGEFVDNAFAAPGAKGCGQILLGLIPISIDPLVNLQTGLPSPAGTNETRQEFDIEATLSEFVYP